jgi:capsular polysaccharide biosynthesis protein
VLGLLIALFLEWSRVDLVQSPQQVEAALELPVLGSIPATTRRGTGSMKSVDKSS